MGMSVTTLLLKTLENATKEYARECITRCAEFYGFNGEEAKVRLNLENLTIQVKEMKKRSVANKKVVVEKKVAEKKKKALCMLPFIVEGIDEEGCEGLAYNSGLFTQCEKVKMVQEGSLYCKTCQHDADGAASGVPSCGNVYQRSEIGLMEFCDGKGRSPIAYSKIMLKKGISRETAELEAKKLNLTIDEVHFAVVEEKKNVLRKGEKAGRPKAVKKSKVVVETVEDLFAQMVDEEEDDESTTSTVLMSDSEGENEDEENKARQVENEKAERGLMKEADGEMKKVVKGEKKAEDLILKAQLKEQKAAEDLAAKEQKAAKLITDKLEKDEKMAAELIVKAQLKEQKVIDDLAAKEAKAQQLIADKEAKAQQLIADKEAKAQQLIADKEAKVAAELATKEQKAAKMIMDKALAQEAKEQKASALKATKDAKLAAPKKAVKAPEPKKGAVKKAASSPALADAPNSDASAVPKKVTVRRITIDGKQYLKTADNLLYDPETREEMGIYDEASNTIKELPDDDDDEIEEDGYDSSVN